MDLFDSPSCISCPFHTTTRSTGSTNYTDCEACPYPFKTNTEGSTGCPGVLLDVKYSSFVIWYGLGLLFLWELLDSCHYDISLAFKVLTFGELIVITSVFDFFSDIYYILNEQFYNIYLFGFMVASLGISLFIFPNVLYREKLFPAMWGGNIDKFYPGFKLISKKVFFLTYRNGFVAVDQQVVFKRPSKEHLENLSGENLELKMQMLKLSTEDIEETHYVDILDTYYDSQDWNPFFFTSFGKMDRLYQYIMYKLVEILLFVAQIVNIIMYSVWHLIIFLRIPIVLTLMIFYSSTKLIFLRRTWNKVMYMWTLREDDEEVWRSDRAKLRGEGKSHYIDLELLHSVKQQETLIEVAVQFVLQLVNAALRRQLSDVYIVSVVGTAFDLLSCVYRYGWYYFNDVQFKDVEDIEVRKIEQAFLQHEERLGREKLSPSHNHKLSLFKTTWKTMKDVYVWGREKIVDAATGGICKTSIVAFNLRVEEEVQKQTENILDEILNLLPEKSKEDVYSREEITIAIIGAKIKIQEKRWQSSASTSTSADVDAGAEAAVIEMKNI